jgi:hypothetical protein
MQMAGEFRLIHFAHMGYIVTDLVRRQVRKLFAPDEAELVISELETSPLPLIDDGKAPERIHLAVLHLSGGDLKKFDEVFRGGRIDWRDTLGAAGLGNADWPDVLRSRGIDFRGTYAEMVNEELRRLRRPAAQQVAEANRRWPPATAGFRCRDVRRAPAVSCRREISAAVHFEPMKQFRITVGLVGAALLVLGIFHTVSGVLRSYHSDLGGQAVTLMVPNLWVAAAFLGALLCVLCFSFGKIKIEI